MTTTKAKIIRTETGRVVSNKMDKTITVLVERQVADSLYKKIVKKSSKLKAHDEQNECQEGDVVRIQETRPIAKTKSWKLVEILERAAG
ncbi:MAG: 30S ribosomal protein S17 [Gammaproteobacteria bacterium]|nr:30S ribosomal protein S17 [Gammaproteobacteria bacterium]